MNEWMRTKYCLGAAGYGLLGSLWWFLNPYEKAESNGKLPHLFIPSKTTTLVPEFWGVRPAFGQTWSLGAWVCSEKPALGQNTLMMMMMMMMMIIKRTCFQRLKLSVVFSWENLCPTWARDGFGWFHTRTDDLGWVEVIRIVTTFQRMDNVS